MNERPMLITKHEHIKNIISLYQYFYQQNICFQGDKIKFHATEIESFYIIKIPEKETGFMKPEGNTLSFKENRGVSLKIPSQAVDRIQPITMEVSFAQACSFVHCFI